MIFEFDILQIDTEAYVYIRIRDNGSGEGSFCGHLSMSTDSFLELYRRVARGQKEPPIGKQSDSNALRGLAELADPEIRKQIQGWLERRQT